VGAAVRKLKGEGGQAVVEFVLILPIFLGLLFAAIGYGITLNNYERVTDIARVAARAAAIGRFDPRFAAQSNPPCAAANAAAQQAANGLTITAVNCSPNSPPAPGDPITISVTIQSENAIRTVPFLNLLLPSDLTGDSTALAQ